MFPKILRNSLTRVASNWLAHAAPHVLKPDLQRVSVHEPHFLEREHISRTDYDAIWQSSFGSSEGARRGYFIAHKERYFELVSTIAYYLPSMEARPRVLEVGVSEYITLYKRFFPTIQLISIDRPSNQHGADGRWLRDVAGVEEHYSIDLNVHSPTIDFGNPPLSRFDFIVFTEVIEHLTTNPVELLGSMISLLKPGGLLYLTTPNFLRLGNLEKLDRGENPQAVFPKRGDNWDAHHHFREYCLNELIGFIEEAGGVIHTKYFSACWDSASLGNRDPALRSNIVLIIGLADPSTLSG